jgi:antitoxin (DNA-binding transcriptional repressor) of toxin-antitoxin stability system
MLRANPWHCCHTWAFALRANRSFVPKKHIDPSFAHIYPQTMQVSLKYAQEHLPDLAIAASNGEEVEIALPGKPGFVLLQWKTPAPFKRTTPRILGEGIGEMVVPDFEEWQAMDSPSWTAPERPRAELFGSLNGKIEFVDGWDSPETNKEIEELFENSEIFPDTSHP